ncbi:MAG: hypothetical protein ABI639_14250 [Thermoanaerobaculia bacterium]
MTTNEPDRTSEYDELFGDPGDDERGANEALAVRRSFHEAAKPYLSSALPWFSWALLFPAAALLSDPAFLRYREPGVIGLWSSTILVGGAIEATTILRRSARRGRSPLGAWAMRTQGNLSLVAVLLSALFVWLDAARSLPGLWLLLLGHNFFALGGLAFRPMRVAGVVYQLGGVVALIPGAQPLWAMAVATAFGNFWIGLGILRQRSATAASGDGRRG